MTTIKPILSNKIGYCLRLANGQGWHLIATDGVESWVEKLASIMELRLCDGNGYQKLIFTRRETDKERWEEPVSCLSLNIQENPLRNGREVCESHTIFGTPDIFCEIGQGEGYELDIVRKSLALYPIFERAQSSGGLPLHAGLVERDGKGILLAASGNIGKSTCCRRLCSPWHPLCDDETLVVLNHQKRYLAHPFPTWSEYLWRRSEQTWNIEYHLPLAAIFFLEQAETDAVLPIGQGEAAVHINHSATQACRRRLYHLDRQETKSLRMKLFENACELAKAIPAFKLRVSLTGRFWEKIEEVLP